MRCYGCLGRCSGVSVLLLCCAAAFLTSSTGATRHKGPHMNRLFSLFKRRPTAPTSTSFFSTNSPRLASALQPASDMSPALYPPSSTAASETYGDFDLVKRVKLSFSDVTVSSWRSRVTGLNVVHLDYEGERTAAVCLPSSYVHCVYSTNSSYREWLFCSGHRKCA